MRRWLLLIFMVLLAGCAAQKEAITEITENDADNMKLTSAAFQEGKPIPKDYTCDGSNILPPLAIGDVPKGAKSLALIMDDPDAPMGTFVHWVAWNINPAKKEISEGEMLDAPQGITDFRRKGYGGPCPPSGVHRYFFKLYALDTILDLPEGSTKKDLEKAMQGHIVADAKLIGVYSRQR